MRTVAVNVATAPEVVAVDVEGVVLMGGIAVVVVCVMVDEGAVDVDASTVAATVEEVTDEVLWLDVEVEFDVSVEWLDVWVLDIVEDVRGVLAVLSSPHPQSESINAKHRHKRRLVKGKPPF